MEPLIEGRKFVKLLAEAGFSIILTCDSFADRVLEKNHAPYRRENIIEALTLCAQFRLNCSVNLIFGLPGETYDTIDQTLAAIAQYPENAFRNYECTFGARIYQGTPLCRLIDKKKDRHHLFGNRSEGFLEPIYYCSPDSPFKIKAYIQQNASFSWEYRKRGDGDTHGRLAVSFLSDQGLWEPAVNKFFESDLKTCASIYDYLFRRLCESGETKAAQAVSEQFLRAILQSGESDAYRDQIPLIQYYISLFASQRRPQ